MDKVQRHTQNNLKFATDLTATVLQSQELNSHNFSPRVCILKPKEVNELFFWNGDSKNWHETSDVLKNSANYRTRGKVTKLNLWSESGELWFSNEVIFSLEEFVCNMGMIELTGEWCLCAWVFVCICMFMWNEMSGRSSRLFVNKLAPGLFQWFPLSKGFWIWILIKWAIFLLFISIPIVINSHVESYFWVEKKIKYPAYISYQYGS